MSKIDDILKKYWGYDSFRPLQREVIESVVGGNDTLALMPTGGGKSITYQVSALTLDGLCLVVTPLISLMKDQIDALKKRNILALAVHSGMSSADIDRTLDNCLYGDYKFLYVSPERLETAIFKSRFARMNVSMIAVDEAHCISQWGYDFRPSYLNISAIRPLAPDAIVLAVTATATSEVVADIRKQLNFYGDVTFRMSFARKNLSYLVRDIEDKKSQILKVLYGVDGVGIIYCRTRKECEEIADFINQNGIKASFYHGGLSYPIRSIRQEEWLSEKTRVIVATNAFGMGIDKPNVRFVIHHQMPDSLEAYYQEAGRAGRDGKESYALLLNCKKDVSAVETRVTKEFIPIEQIKKMYSLLCNHFQIAFGEGEESVHDFNIYDFCSKFRVSSNIVNSALSILQICGYITVTDNIDNPTRIRFSVSREELYKISIIREDLERFISLLLRLYTGLFTQFANIDEKYLSHVSGYSLEYINDAFKKLGMLRVINYIPSRKTPLIIFNTERLSEDNLRVSPESYTHRKDMYQKRVDAMIEYVENKKKCRGLMLQHYFDDMSSEKCGKCDICRDKKRIEANRDSDRTAQIEEYIIEKLSKEDIDIKKITLMANAPASHFVVAIKSLIEKGKIVQKPNGKLSLQES